MVRLRFTRIIMFLLAFASKHFLVKVGGSDSPEGTCKEFTFTMESGSEKDRSRMWSSKMAEIEKYIRDTLLTQNGDINIHTEIIHPDIITTEVPNDGATTSGATSPINADSTRTHAQEYTTTRNEVDQTSTPIPHQVTTTQATTAGETTSGAASPTSADSTPAEENITNQNEVDQTPTSSDLHPCNGEEGLIYQMKCYYIIWGTVNLVKAKELCTAKGGRPADIENSVHQDMVTNYVRKMMTSAKVYIWLGMSYRAGTLRFFNENDATNDFAAPFPWWNNYPMQESSREAMEIIVGTDIDGFGNLYSTDTTSGVLCQNENAGGCLN